MGQGQKRLTGVRGSWTGNVRIWIWIWIWIGIRIRIHRRLLFRGHVDVPIHRVLILKHGINGVCPGLDRSCAVTHAVEGNVLSIIARIVFDLDAEFTIENSLIFEFEREGSSSKVP